MNIKDQQDIRERLATLPPELKKALDVVNVDGQIAILIKKHNLLLDQADNVALEIYLAITGIEPLSDFISNLVQHAGVNTSEATLLASDVNSEIFLKIRQVLIDAKNIDTTFKPNLSRESILAEIENPTPSIHPISAADQTVAGPAVAREILPETKSTVARDFIGSKLTETVSLPAQKASVTLKTPEKPKNYTTDPYREALN